MKQHLFEAVEPKAAEDIFGKRERRGTKLPHGGKPPLHLRGKF